MGENGRMNLRALIVLLAVLNLGVAAWWLFRPDAAPVAAETAPSGIARLQLLSERPTKPSQATPPAPEDTSATARTEPPIVPERCFRFGPFADADALAIDTSCVTAIPRPPMFSPTEPRAATK